MSKIVEETKALEKFRMLDPELQDCVNVVVKQFSFLQDVCYVESTNWNNRDISAKCAPKIFTALKSIGLITDDVIVLEPKVKEAIISKILHVVFDIDDYNADKAAYDLVYYSNGQPFDLRVNKEHEWVFNRLSQLETPDDQLTKIFNLCDKIIKLATR